jgi:hypothetical protein
LHFLSIIPHITEGDTTDTNRLLEAATAIHRRVQTVQASTKAQHKSHTQIQEAAQMAMCKHHVSNSTSAPMDVITETDAVIGICVLLAAEHMQPVPTKIAESLSNISQQVLSSDLSTTPSQLDSKAILKLMRMTLKILNLPQPLIMTY